MSGAITQKIWETIQPRKMFAVHDTRTFDTVVAIELPERSLVHLRPAGPPARLVAWLMDLVLRAAVAVLIGLPLSVLGEAGSGLMLLFFFFLEWLYPVYFEVLHGGQTPGKQAMGLCVLQSSGQPVGWSSSLLRNLLRVADFLPVAFAFGLLSMLLTERFLRLGDMVAGTIVVHLHGAPVLARKARPRPLPLPTIWLPTLKLLPEERQALVSLSVRAAFLGQERVNDLIAVLAPALARRAQIDISHRKEHHESNAVHKRSPPPLGPV